MKKNKGKNLVRASGGAFMLNQHAPKFADKRTKRDRSRNAQKNNAIKESGE